MKSAITRVFSAKEVLQKLHLLDLARRVRFKLMNVQASWLQLIYPNGKYIQGPNQCSVYADFKNPNFRWYYGKNLFLEQEHTAFTRLFDLKNPSVVVDIGAHWGVFPAMLEAGYHKFPSIKHVICIEPDPENIPILKKTASKIKNFKVTVIESAIGEIDSEVIAHREGGACLQTYNNHNYDSSIKVAIKKIETILSQLDVVPDEVTHIKIDIDGYEPSFFFGSQDWLKNVNPFILTEYWAAGLEKHPNYSTLEYFSVLLNQFYVVKCNYPEGTYSILNIDDLEDLNLQTQTAVVNLLLIPKTTMNIESLKRIFNL